MRLWQRNVVSLLAIGGGAVGAFATVVELLIPAVNDDARILVLLAPFVALYVWGIWCGMQLLRNRKTALWQNLVFWAIQIPVIQSSFISIWFVNGFHTTLAVHSPLVVSFRFALGSAFYVTYNSRHPFAIGINIFALMVTVFIYRQLRKPTEQEAVGPPPLPPLQPGRRASDRTDETSGQIG